MSSSVSKQELAQLQEIILNFRVNELHLLLTSFRVPKLGKKQELVDRALQLLNKPAHQAHVIERIRQIQKSTTAHQNYRSQPYSYGHTNTNMPNQNTGMRHLVGSNYDPRYAANMYPTNYTGVQNYQSLLGQNYGGYGQQQQGYHQQSQGIARNLKISNLPFYDTEQTLMELSDLPAQINSSRPMDCKRQYQFYIPHQEIYKLQYRSEPVKLPRYEVQLRMFQLELDGEQPDAFPPQCIVYLDDQPVGLPAIIPTNKPNAEQKRLSRPVNLTTIMQHTHLRSDRPYRITVQWQGDKRAWAIGVWLVKRVNTEILQERLLNNPNARRAFAVTKRNIVRRLAGDEDDVQMDSIKVSLIDPLVKTRIKIPARSSDCEHLQCFDLTNFLMMNEKRPGWKCAICNSNAHYSKLIVDEYYEKLINDVSKSVDEVELLRDGTWRVVKDECEMLSDSDNEVATASSKSVPKPSAASTPASQSKKPEQKQEPEIDEEATLNRPPPSASATSSASGNQFQHPSSNRRPNIDSNSSDDSIIVLDDSDDQPEHPVSPPQPSTAPPSVSQSNFNNSVGTPPINLPRASSDSEPKAKRSKPNQEDQESAASTPPLVPTSAISSFLPNVNHNSAPSTPGAMFPTGQLNQQAFQQAAFQAIQKAAAASSSGQIPQLLQTATNGFHSGMYRPIIKEAAEVQIAAELAQFLATVYQKNAAAASAQQNASST